MSDHPANGGSPGGHSMDEIVASLRVELDAAERKLADIEAQAAPHREKVGKLRKAIAALDERHTWRQTARSRPGRRATTAFVRPAEETIERVLAGLIAAGEPRSIPALCDEIDGISRDTVRRALYALRDEGRVRVTGKTGVGGGSLYAPMPEEIHAQVGER